MTTAATPAAPAAPVPSNLSPANPAPLVGGSIDAASMAELHAARATQPPSNAAPPALQQGLDPAGLEAARQADLAARGGTQPPTSPTTPAPEPRKTAREALADWRPKGEQPAKQWDALKQKHEQELNALRQELETFKKQATSPAQPLASDELKKLNEELNQYRDIVRTAAAERDPALNAKYETQRKAAISQTALIVGEDGGKLEKLLRMPTSEFRDAQIDKLIGELPATAQRRIQATLATLDQIDIARGAEIEATKATWDARQQAQLTQAQQQGEQRKAALLGAFDQIHKSWRAEMPYMTHIEGNAEHNAMADETANLARAIFQGELDANELANAAHLAAIAPRALKELYTARQALEQLQADNDRLRGVVPGVGSVATPANGAITNAPQPGSDAYDNYFRDGLQQAQAADRGKRGYH